MRKESPLIYDSGNQTRCFTFVDDAIEGVILASNNDRAIGEVFNIGSNVETSMKEVVDISIEESGNKLNPKFFDTKKEYGKLYEDISRRIPDVKKAKDILGWSAQTSLRQGIKATIDWANKNIWWLD